MFWYWKWIYLTNLSSIFIFFLGLCNRYTRQYYTIYIIGLNNVQFLQHSWLWFVFMRIPNFKMWLILAILLHRNVKKKYVVLNFFLI